MKIFVRALITALFMNISLNHFLICILTNRINIIPIAPKLTTPKLLLYLWMTPEQFFGSDTFYCLRYLFGGHHRNTLQQKMNMIFIRTNFDKMYFKSFLYIRSHLNQTLFRFLRQNTSPIFYRTNQMIKQ